MAMHRTLLTAEELLQMEDSTRYELVKGELVYMSPAGMKHGNITGDLASRMIVHAQTNLCGEVFVKSGYILEREPDTVRGPDISFVSKARIPKEGIPDGFFEMAPDVAVEIVSPSDRYQDIEEKVHEYLNAGSKMVWVVSPKQRTVTVYRSLTDVKVLTEKEELTGDDVISGFRCAVREIFE